MRCHLMFCLSVELFGLWSCGADVQRQASAPTLLRGAMGNPASAAEEDGDEPFIVGGVEVDGHDAVTRSTVALLQPSGWQFCSGSLIARRFVVTAAHCLKDYRDSELLIGFGTKAETAFAQASSRRKAAKFIVNAAFDTDALSLTHPDRPPNDIALITLAEEAPRGFVPVPMLAMHDKLKVGERLTLAGFGLTSAEAGTSGILRKVHTKLLGVDRTADELEFGGTPGRSACMGDSGGPAFVKRRGKLRLVGVTSRGAAGCLGGGIYTDVRQFQKWLRQEERQELANLAVD